MPQKLFEKCPACGSKKRFFESMAKELGERGICRPGFNMTYDTRSNICVDPETVGKIPIGSRLTQYKVFTDICEDCGCVYAVLLEKNEVKRSAPPLPPIRKN